MYVLTGRPAVRSTLWRTHVFIRLVILEASQCGPREPKEGSLRRITSFGSCMLAGTFGYCEMVTRTGTKALKGVCKALFGGM